MINLLFSLILSLVQPNHSPVQSETNQTDKTFSTIAEKKQPKSINMAESEETETEMEETKE